MPQALSQASVLALVGLSAADLRTVAMYVICLVIAISIHEFAHAFAADRLGDPTPNREGRLTLNPVSHADPVGTLALPVLAGLFHLPLLGWGRPVPTQPSYYSRRLSMRGGLALVAVAGPLSNLLQAALTLVALKLVAVAGVSSRGLDEILLTFFQLNLILFAFNLLPIHPLDGGKILAWLLPARWNHIDDFLARWGGLIVITMVVAFPSVLSAVLSPIFWVAQASLRLVGL